MKTMSLKYAVGMILLAVLLHGCAKPPAEEMSKAEKAIGEAKQKEVDLYAEDYFKKAEEYLKKSRDLVAEKKYKEAKDAALEALNAAQQGIALALPNKEKMKAEAEQMLQEVRTALDELKARVARAVRNKSKIDREELERLIGKWEIDLSSIGERIKALEIRQAYDELKALKEQVMQETDKLTTPEEKKQREKKAVEKKQ